MYEVLLNGKTLYYPASDKYNIYDTNLDLDVGLAGEFKFSVPPTNPLYSQIGQGSIITILRDDVEFWRGELKEMPSDVNNCLQVYALEDLSWLDDEPVAPSKNTSETYGQRLQAMIDAYNSSRPIDRQFEVGYITNVNTSNTCTWKTEYGWGILTCIRECIAKSSGYVRVRRVNGHRYIDVVKLADYGMQSSQTIQFGTNLLDYVREFKLNNFTNAIQPYGAELETELYTEYPQRVEGTPIQNAESIATFGRHAKGVIFDGVTDVDSLDSLARAYLTRYSQPQIRMKVKAIDLGDIGNNAHFNIGDSIRIVAEPYGIDQWVYLTKQSIDLQDAGKNEVELSSYVTRGATLTEQTVETADLIKDIPSKSSILEAAKKNALEILNGENGGVIYFVSNEDNQIIEQRILNNADIDQATKAWRWNINGLAYLSRTYPSNPWNVGVAITMDGAIVADYITTGVLNADLIKAGIISDVSGKFSLNMNTGAIVMNNATLNSATIQGSIQASSGYIGSSQYGFIIGDTQIWTVNGPSSIGNTWNTGAYYGINGVTVNAGGSHTHVMGSEISTPTIYVKNFQYSSYSGSGRFYPNERSGEGELVLEGTYAARIIVMSMAGRYSYSDLGPANQSDARLKHDIKQIDVNKLRAFFDIVKPVSFIFNTDVLGRVRYGVVAQELELALEQSDIDKGIFVQEDKSSDEHYKSIVYSEFHGLELAAIKDLYQIINEQQKQIDELKKEIQILKEERNG